MRHGKKFNHLGRTASHRSAMLSNMASSLIINKRITTTTAKAKALRKYVEPLITKSKTDTTQSRRVVFSYLQDKVSSQILFDEVAEKVADRPGGYTRIIKLGNRLGDAAEMAMIELVDFNEIYNAKEETKTRTRRSRRGRGGKKRSDENADTSSQAQATGAAVADAPLDSPTDPPEATDTSVQTAETETSTDKASTEEQPHVVHVTETEDDVVHLSGEAALDEEVIVEEVDESEAASDEAASDEVVADESTTGQTSADRPTATDMDKTGASEEDEEKPKQ